MDDGSCELVGGGITAQILGADLSSLQDVVNGTVNLLAVVGQVDMTQHLRGTQKHGSWIGDILADSSCEGVTRSLKSSNRNLLE